MFCWYIEVIINNPLVNVEEINLGPVLDEISVSDVPIEMRYTPYRPGL